MLSVIKFSLLGYLSGSVLYARIFAKLFSKEDMIANSPDKNPGAANAFRYGGFWCGILTLWGDIMKGFLPVWFFFHESDYLAMPALWLVIAAPVFGHVFPLFFRFRGGKGIAVTFGCLLGLIPVWQPFAYFAGVFLLFSLIIRITPHFHRTLISYIATLICLCASGQSAELIVAFLLITCAVCLRLLMSKEPREHMKIQLL